MLMKYGVHNLKDLQWFLPADIQFCMSDVLPQPFQLRSISRPVLLFYYKQSFLNSNLIRPHAYIKYSRAFAL